MDLSFQERSVAVSLLVISGIYGYYFYGVLAGTGPVTPGGMLGDMLAICIVLVVVEIVFHSVIAAFVPQESADERDRLIVLRAYRVAYLVLVFGVIAILGGMLAGSVFGATPFGFLDIANQLLFVLVAAEIVQFATQLVCYRRGVFS